MAIQWLTTHHINYNGHIAIAASDSLLNDYRMDELNTFVLAYLAISQERRAKSEQILLTEASHVSQGTCQKNKDCQQVLTDLFTTYTHANLSFYDICPVDSFERIN